MDIRLAVRAALAALVTFVVLDALWLVLYAVPAFQREIGAILRPDPQLWAVGVFYLIYAAALTILVIMPSRSEAVAAALWKGALFGLAAYGTYDLTNLATIRGWTLSLAAADMGWGAFCTAVSAAAGHLAVVRSS